MTGNKVKEILDELGLSQRTVAKRINVSPQMLSAALQSDDVRSGLLEKIAEGIEKDMSIFYNVCSNSNSHNSVNNGNLLINPEKDRALEILNEQLAKKDEQISGLIKALNRS